MTDRRSLLTLLLIVKTFSWCLLLTQWVNIQTQTVKLSQSRTHNKTRSPLVCTRRLHSDAKRGPWGQLICPLAMCDNEEKTWQMSKSRLHIIRILQVVLKHQCSNE